MLEMREKCRLQNSAASKSPPRPNQLRALQMLNLTRRLCLSSKRKFICWWTLRTLSPNPTGGSNIWRKLQQKTVPKGLKIKPVKAKSKSEDLQKKFDNILHEAELKLLDVTLESLRKEVLETEQSVAHCKEDIKATIDRWRSFPLKDKKSTRKAD